MDLVKIMLGAAGIASVVVVLPALGFLFGAFCGAIVGWVFDDTFLHASREIGTTLAPWQIGGLLGFVGGYFRTSTSK